MRFQRLFGAKENSETTSSIFVEDLTVSPKKPEGINSKGRPSRQEPPSSAGLYRITDRQTDEKLYIGETKDLRRRKEEHKKSGRYSPDAHNFEWKTASSTSTSFDRRDRESRWIEKHHPSGNRRAGGAGRRPNADIKTQSPELYVSESSNQKVESSRQGFGFGFKRKRGE